MPALRAFRAQVAGYVYVRPQLLVTNPFIGTWRGPDEYTSEVEYTVSCHGDTLAVTAIDPSDGETAVVSDVSFSADRLTFNALWESTGRVARCIVELVGENEAKLTFTYTDHARLVRRAA